MWNERGLQSLWPNRVTSLLPRERRVYHPGRTILAKSSATHRLRSAGATGWEMSLGWLDEQADYRLACLKLPTSKP